MVKTMGVVPRNIMSKGVQVKALYSKGVKVWPSVSEFLYTGTVQNFIAPQTGYYQLEVWGGLSGGWRNNPTSAMGGYSNGYTHLEAGEILYIVCGNRGRSSIYPNGSGYNGGGNGRNAPSFSRASDTGGGATHIAKITGLLSDLEMNKSDILIVAGGGGTNGYWGSGGVGGGLNGGDSTGYPLISGLQRTYQTGASQTGSGTYGSLGSFGLGADATNDYVGAGGGGWFGGSTVMTSGTSVGAGGGGGSGYIGGVEGGTTINGVNFDSGKAKITIITDLSLLSLITSPKDA